MSPWTEDNVSSTIVHIWLCFDSGGATGRTRPNAHESQRQIVIGVSIKSKSDSEAGLTQYSIRNILFKCSSTYL